MVSWLDAKALEGAPHSIVEEHILDGGTAMLRRLSPGPSRRTLGDRST
jgi:hypothetical protein